MSDVLARWNGLTLEQAVEEILPCCGSKAWASGMAGRRPLSDESSLLATSDGIWSKLPEAAWLEAFRSHPRIGELKGPASTPAQSAAWSSEEQRKVSAADENV